MMQVVKHVKNLGISLKSNKSKIFQDFGEDELCKGTQQTIDYQREIYCLTLSVLGGGGANKPAVCFRRISKFNTYIRLLKLRDFSQNIV